MRVLVVGLGGREHALAARLAESPRLSELHAAPGNPGIEQVAQLHDVPVTDIEGMVELAARLRTDLVVVGPEAPLVAGLADRLERRGLTVFGPGQRAAQIEGSKEFAKRVMDTAGVATAEYWACDTVAAAQAAVAELNWRVVIKADGLAAGKGVFVCDTAAEAEQAIRACLVDQEFGASGTRILVEQRLSGPEVSVLALCDGERVLPLAPARDHKRVGDGDQGPNTGGMGAYSPAPIVTPQLHARVMREIILPTVAGMEKEGIRYTGFLYAGLMIDAQGNPKTLEFNCRMGDPETQPIMARLKGDFSKVVEHAIAGTLNQVELEWDRRTALGVVLAAYNYPETPRKGDRISEIPAETDDSVTFHAGTQLVDGKLVTAGGRVLCVVGLADSVRSAQNVAYETVNRISFDGMQYRHDIGYRAAGRKQ